MPFCVVVVIVCVVVVVVDVDADVFSAFTPFRYLRNHLY